MQLAGAFVFPVAFLHAFMRWLIGKPNVQFAKRQNPD
jgi:hypothetical protein